MIIGTKMTSGKQCKSLKELHTSEGPESTKNPIIGENSLPSLHVENALVHNTL